MSMRNATHAEFVANFKSLNDTVQVAINSKELVNVFVSLEESKTIFPDSLMRHKKNKLIKPLAAYQKHKAFFWAMNFLLLITPLRMFLLATLVFAGVMHLAYKIFKDEVFAHMASSEEFYQKMVDDRVVIVSIADTDAVDESEKSDEKPLS
ncbi:hypothetical protein ACXHQ0_19040 [Vibrio antiquarius]|uniref:Uncharacterized protein n=1 Tax=Vibrio parahaemolyticus TaxID=670 RepID=A0A8H9TKB4_VIBPH|nr:hypothetical protein [Vibrio parahaemolyticus]EGR5928086.1 hypothetical protein [Vibrio parahaemolyticus]KOY38045.1 hypothetical protein ACX10_12440 [Vibrio parahaemolyticus]MCS0114856.1 hypothetical protein [Vibrio parahaemolyticus]UYV30333.1 hypothetical protein M5598_25330 [Vibrio parahaemolyticus]UYW19657.1 hypothetical protein IF561_25325 [Vibrio parahaemolyticus]